jgi:queuine tRNA-ribosyltransferase/7-cyano-7-deazaguanine tRNA-ribosyltransferase
MAKFSFRVTAQDKKTLARTGIVRTAHGSFRTPAFVPVATAASVRGLGNDDLKALKAEVILTNTYHLHLRPGDKLIRKLGGLHKFMNWDGPIITDSGGFQAFSLGYGMEHGIGKIGNIFTGKGKANNEKWAFIDDEGVEFRNPITGEKVKLTPRMSMEIQSNLGSDIILAFDECTSPLSGYKYTKSAMERTHRWAIECLEHRDKKQALFGIVQGGAYKRLRMESSAFINSLGFDGLAIGGSLGKSKRDMHNVLEWCIPLLNREKPIHLLGIGAVEDLFEAVERGVDIFDCVAPTRWARRGHLYISPAEEGSRENKFRINIGRSRFKEDKKPIDRKCSCYACRNFSRAYLRHLYLAKELLFFRLTSLHNLNFMLRLMETIRNSVKKGSFGRLKERWLE